MADKPNPLNEVTSSQFNPNPANPKPTEGLKSGPTDANKEGTKATEHGIEKDSKTGSALAAGSTESAPKAASPASAKLSANNPNPSAAKASTTAPKTASTSATNPAKLADGKLGITSIETEGDHSSGVLLKMKRSDGINLQFPMTFDCRQDLYASKNMFALLGKMVSATEEELRANYPAFIKE